MHKETLRESFEEFCGILFRDELGSGEKCTHYTQVCLMIDSKWHTLIRLLSYKDLKKKKKERVRSEDSSIKKKKKRNHFIWVC